MSKKEKWDKCPEVQEFVDWLRTQALPSQRIACDQRFLLSTGWGKQGQ
jgi:hypothetical protein